MKIIKKLAAVLLIAATVLCFAACGEKSESEKIKNIEKPETANSQNEESVTVAANAVEESANVNGMRFNMTLKEFTEKYNAEKTRRKESDLLVFGSWQKNGNDENDANGVDVEYWNYDDTDVSFTVTVESQSKKLLNIGCGTTMSRFMDMTDGENNSDIILTKAALMAEAACGFPVSSEPVLQDIFYRTTTENNDTLWYKGFVFHLSTKEDKNDSKNNIMLFRVFPVTDELKKEWELIEY